MGVQPRLRGHRQGEGAWVMGGGEFPLDDVQESSPLVKLQDAARATAEMWPRLNGASPRRERAGDGAGAEAGAGNGAGAGHRDGVWSLIAQVREWSRGCSIPPPGTGLGKGNGRGWSRGLPTP